MSKVISFSISDKYLDKLRALYPALTDNLAAKQFLTDRLDSSLGNSLDVSLNDGLDDRVKTLIESWVDGLLEVRLDASVGKLITSLSDRLSRLEEKLDDSLDGSLDDMERLLRLQREASIAAPIPTGDTSPDEADQPAIGTVTPEVSPSPPLPPDAIEDSEKKIIPLPDTLIVSPIETVESVCEDEPDAIESLAPKVSLRSDLTNKEKAAILGIGDSNLSKWVRNGEIPKKYDNKCRFNENKTKIILI